MKICDYLTEQQIIAEMSGKTKKQVLEELVTHLAAQDPAVQGDELLKVLVEREKLGSTGIGNGIAIPHGKLTVLEDIAMVFGRCRDGIDFDAIDGKPVNLFFLLVAPAQSAGVHLKALARLSRLLKNNAFRQQLIDAQDSAALYSIIVSEDEKVRV